MRRLFITIIAPALAAVTLAVILSGCGQTGDLYFPDKSRDTSEASA